jgi:hypothetical protein
MDMKYALLGENYTNTQSSNEVDFRKLAHDATLRDITRCSFNEGSKR